MSTTTERRTRDVVFVRLTTDGRLAGDRALAELAKHAPDSTDCFVFSHGWLYDEGEARQEAARFFGRLDAALATLGDRIRPLRVALYWELSSEVVDERERRRTLLGKLRSPTPRPRWQPGERYATHVEGYHHEVGGTDR